MIIAVASSSLLMLGAEIALALKRYDPARTGRAEMVCGSLLAAGLMLIGVGIHSTFG